MNVRGGVAWRASLRHWRGGGAQLDVLVAVALGGALGATARYELAVALPTAAGRFPWATFWTNVAGSFLLGFLLVLLLERFPPTRYVRPFVGSGLLGALTTMSTFLVEAAVLIKHGHVATGLLYVLGSVAAGLVVASAGISAARRIPIRQRGAASTPRLGALSPAPRPGGRESRIPGPSAPRLEAERR